MAVETKIVDRYKKHVHLFFLIFLPLDCWKTMRDSSFQVLVIGRLMVINSCVWGKAEVSFSYPELMVAYLLDGWVEMLTKQAVRNM